MANLICSTQHGGCGFIGHSSEFRIPPGEKGEDLPLCPACKEDHCFLLSTEGLELLTDESNRELARKIVGNDPSIVGRANCGCVYHAESEVACPHDIALAREKHARKRTM